VDTATFAAQGWSIRYFSGGDRKLGDFRSDVFDAANQEIASSNVRVIPDGGLPGLTVTGFHDPMALNAIAPTPAELLAGESKAIVRGGLSGVIYESRNAGPAPIFAGAQWDQVHLNGSLGLIAALAYGGRHSSVDNPDVLYAADSGHVYLRTAPGNLS